MLGLDKQLVGLLLSYSSASSKTSFSLSWGCRRLAVEKPNAPALLYVDGHSSRRNPDTLAALAAANVTVITFVAHASHLLQPLDRWLFLMFKNGLNKLGSKIRDAPRPDQRLTMLREVESAMHNASTPSNVRKSFARAGLWPIDPSQVFTPQHSPEVPQRPKRNRKSVKINGQVLTGEDIIGQLREEKQRKKPEKESSKRKKVRTPKS